MATAPRTAPRTPAVPVTAAVAGPKLGSIAVHGLNVSQPRAVANSRLGVAPLVGVTVVELDGGRGMTVAGRALTAGGNTAVALNAARHKPESGNGPSAIQGSGGAQQAEPDVGTPLGLFVSERQ